MVIGADLLRALEISMLFLPESDLLHSYLATETFKECVDRTIRSVAMGEDDFFTEESDVLKYSRVNPDYFFDEGVYDAIANEMNITIDKDDTDGGLDILSVDDKTKLPYFRRLTLSYGWDVLKKSDINGEVLFIDPFLDNSISFNTPFEKMAEQVRKDVGSYIEQWEKDPSEYASQVSYFIEVNWDDISFHSSIHDEYGNVQVNLSDPNVSGCEDLFSFEFSTEWGYIDITDRIEELKADIQDYYFAYVCDE